MFAILLKDFNGRQTRRYFNDWNNAKAELKKDAENCCKLLEGTIIDKVDIMNTEKGWYECSITASFPTLKEKCKWSIVEAYFEDFE